MPLYHCFGMVMGVLGCTAVGAKMVFPDTGFDADLTLRAVEREACTALYGVPTMFVAMLEHPDFSERQLESLRTGIMAGAPCPMDTMRQVITDMHMKEITIAYGMTETSPVSFQSNVDDPIHKRVATVGQVHPHLEVKLVDEAGRIVALGAQGELCTVVTLSCWAIGTIVYARPRLRTRLDGCTRVIWPSLMNVDTAQLWDASAT